MARLHPASPQRQLQGQPRGKIENAVVRVVIQLTDGTKLQWMLSVSRGKEASKGRASQEHGAPGRTRTDNIQLRRLALYPVELRARVLGSTVTLSVTVDPEKSIRLQNQ